MIRITPPSNFKLINTCLIFLICTACTSIDSVTSVKLDVPDHFPQPVDSPKRNSLSQEGIDLGGKLFFDSNLSSNGKVSCSSCHIPNLSFTDGRKLGATGASKELLKRNSPALINLAWMNSFFWDGGVKNLESLPFAALTNPDELGANLNDIVEYLNSNIEYKKEFKTAFGIEAVSSAYVARALAQFQRTLISANSKYDQVQKGEMHFTKQELDGQKIFQFKCASCHTPPLFTDNSFHNNGLDATFTNANEDVRAGRYRITLDTADLGKFKTPTLRNLKYTAPYMHDGRYSNLNEVINHYQNEIIKSETLDARLIDLKLDKNEIQPLLTFLSTLNDEKFAKKYSE
jgi:cytochrome c peroxidase